MKNKENSNILYLPESSFPDLISQATEKMLNKFNWELSCEDIQLTSQEVSSKDGLLPLIMWISGQSLKEIWGDQNLVFRCEEAALCGVVPDLKRPILPLSIWLHAIHFELENLSKEKKLNNQPSMNIDKWFKKWNDALDDKKIALLPPKDVVVNKNTIQK